MPDDLSARIEAALEQESQSRAPDLPWVVVRGRRLRVARVAVLVLSSLVLVSAAGAALMALPRDGDPPNLLTEQPSPLPQEAREGEAVEDMSEQEKAEVFAFRALAATGLMAPVAERTYLWTSREDTTSEGGGWSVGFASSKCSLSTCRGLSGEDPERGNALTDTYVVVELKDGSWEVVGVEGNMLDDERERLVGFTLPERDEASHWEFPATTTRGHDEGFGITMFPLWVGPYPTEAPGSVCRLQPVDENGDPAGSETLFYQEPPRREFERAGSIHSRGVLGAADTAEDVEASCRQYVGEGWEQEGQPAVSRIDGRILGVSADLVWRGEKGFTTPASCRATLLDEDGKKVWEGTGRAEALWRPNELKDYPYRTTVSVMTSGKPVEADSVGDFICTSL